MCTHDLQLASMRVWPRASYKLNRSMTALQAMTTHIWDLRQHKDAPAHMFSDQGLALYAAFSTPCRLVIVDCQCAVHLLADNFARSQREPSMIISVVDACWSGDGQTAAVMYSIPAPVLSCLIAKLACRSWSKVPRLCGRLTAMTSCT